MDQLPLIKMTATAFQPIRIPAVIYLRNPPVTSLVAGILFCSMAALSETLHSR
jgi:hypothetical protein